MYYTYILYFAWADQRRQSVLYFPKSSKDAGWKYSTVMKLICFVTHRIPEGDNCFFAYQHYSIGMNMNIYVHAPSSIATAMSSTSCYTLPLV